MSLTPTAALLATATTLLADGADADGPLTPAGRDRGATYALRIALESSVDAALAAEEAGLGELRSMRAKLLCLHHYAGPARARRVSALWNRLSAGCKYHHDELGPSHAQVRAWRAAVECLATELAAPVASRRPPQRAGGEALAGEDRPGGR
ncbi:hypothetical protein [Streptomyces sp. AC512_CC834]|uniref:hypothetical protein n=1 Tax=Streptomyces sp. AC512_CC834 TaxID=2823691 RepID=UPI001C2691E8|nr:hypothetical protein [Streptomyces sp. AC512_CC834]